MASVHGSTRREFLAAGAGGVAGVPHHEFLHLAQFRRFGVPRVLAHYVRYAAAGFVRHRDLGRAFREVPFEVEARAYDRICLEREGAG